MTVAGFLRSKIASSKSFLRLLKVGILGVCFPKGPFGPIP